MTPIARTSASGSAWICRFCRQRWPAARRTISSKSIGSVFREAEPDELSTELSLAQTIAAVPGGAFDNDVDHSKRRYRIRHTHEREVTTRLALLDRRNEMYNRLDMLAMRRPRRVESYKRPDRRVLITNINYLAVEDDIRLLVEQFGEIERLHLLRRHNTGGFKNLRSLGKVLVQFRHMSDAIECVEKLHRRKWGGFEVLVDYFGRDFDRVLSDPLRWGLDIPPCDTLYVADLPPDVSDADLKKTFGGLKGIMEVKLAMESDLDRCRGYCTIRFQDVRAALKAKHSLVGVMIGPKVLSVFYSRNRALELYRTNPETGIPVTEDLDVENPKRPGIAAELAQQTQAVTKEISNGADELPLFLPSAAVRARGERNDNIVDDSSPPIQKTGRGEQGSQESSLEQRYHHM